MSSDTVRLAFICGSLREGSINKKLENALVLRAREHGADADAVSLGDYEMPIYHGDLDTPDSVTAFAETMANYDGVVIVTPEYNGSLPPLLKNTIDWTSTISTKWIPGQRFGITACTPGPMSGIMCLRELAFILRRLGGDVEPVQVGVGNAGAAFDGQGHLVGQPSSDLADKMLKSMIEKAKRDKAR